MRTKAIIVLLLSFVTISNTGCTGFLDEQNKTQYSAEYIYSTEAGLELAVVGLYALDRLYMDQSESNINFALQRGVDESVTNGGTGNFYGIYDPNYLKPSAAQPANMWKGMYNIIGKCNDIINSAQKLEQTTALEILVAEAKCFRAQCYFMLYRTFDRIWINTTSTTPENVNDERLFRPAAKAEVFNLIYEDLNYAITHLPWKTEKEKGRYNQAAARHLLAKAALWLKDWDMVLTQVNEIEQSGAGYNLVGIDEIFRGADLNHSEALLVQQWSRNPGGNLSNVAPRGHGAATLLIAPYRMVVGGTSEEACSYENYGYTYGRMYPSPYLFSLYDKTKDKRYSSFFIHSYRNTTDKTITTGGIAVLPGEAFPLRDSKGAINKNLYPGCIKYADIWTRSPFETLSYKDIIVFRLAETYIMAAEAAVQKDNQILARKYYNKTWMRAGNDEFTGIVTMKHIIDEQARELCFECDRWYFLKRQGILIEQVSKYAGDPEISASITGRKNLPANPHFVRWPIPEAEIINMGAEDFPQNPGYK